MTAATLDPEKYVQLIAETYLELGDPLTAEGQMKYLKDRFPYYGLKAPQWTSVLRDIFKEHGLFDGDNLRVFVSLCFEQEYREMHYTGLQMLEKKIKRQDQGFIDYLEVLVLTNSWWDTVDWLNKLIGIHLKRYPDLQIPTAEKWIESDNIWLQRLAMIHQLTYREQTDWDLLQSMILRRVQSKEFFVQKAAGWSLRQYSKTNAPAVIAFIEQHSDELPPLAIREGLKWLKSNNLYPA